MLKKENNRFQKREKKTEESLTKAQVGLTQTLHVHVVILVLHAHFALQKETALLSIDRVKNNVLLDCMTATF